MSVERPRIAILGMHLESNAFAPVTTDEDFRAACYLTGQALLDEAYKRFTTAPATS